jgi:RNA polymerase sigma factor (sigma-70 family)
MPDECDERSDEELLFRTVEDGEAFATFYRRYEASVLAYFRRRTAGPEIAADLTAEVFAAALLSARRFQPGEQPAAAWLFGIAHHKLVSSWRRGQVESRARARLRMEPVALEDDDLLQVEAAISTFDLELLLARLPADQREAVRARVLDERDYVDIARELRCSSAVVRKRVSRGLAELRIHIEEGAP